MRVGTVVSEDELPQLSRVALTIAEAAHSLGYSRSYFFAKVLPELRTVGEGRARRVPLEELQRWARENAR